MRHHPWLIHDRTTDRMGDGDFEAIRAAAVRLTRPGASYA